MKIVPAKYFDIDEIMKIERGAFIPQIQENKSTFEQRLQTFSQGFLLLQDFSEETVLQNGKSVTAGYFTSEIWNSIPQSDDNFLLNHSSKIHNETGSVLYVSSFAISKEYRGQGHAKQFFAESLSSICCAYKNIKTILLLVNQEWLSAIKVYESLGFKEIRRIKGFFPSLHNNFSDGIIMTKNVK